MVDDLARLRAALEAAGVAGSDDLGRFVNAEYFRPSTFDERAAMPVLIAALPSLSDAQAAETVARHLRRPWARSAAFDALHTAFTKWATDAPLAGWALGDSMVNAADARHAQVLIAIAVNRRYGRARQMVVHALWRFRQEPGVSEALRSLCSDPDVCLHAMSAYRRAVGPREALPLLEELRQHPDAAVRKQAVAQAKKAAKALAAKSG